jgi:hypothetical protein
LDDRLSVYSYIATFRVTIRICRRSGSPAVAFRPGDRGSGCPRLREATPQLREASPRGRPHLPPWVRAEGRPGWATPCQA